MAKERIDARGLAVAPGFVDIQGGLGGGSISKITQGATMVRQYVKGMTPGKVNPEEHSAPAPASVGRFNLAVGAGERRRVRVPQDPYGHECGAGRDRPNGTDQRL